MGTIHEELQAHWAKAQADAASRKPKRSAPLKGGGGGGTSGGMEARLAKLEAHVEHIQADLVKLAALPVDLATLKVQVENLPTKKDLDDKLETHLRKVGIVVAIISAIFGIFFKVIG